MKEVDLIALAGLLHDIGKFGQRAEIDLRGEFNKNIYGYRHSNYTAQILKDYFSDIEGYHQYAYEHHVVDKNSDENSWIVAVADRIASGFERETFEDYNNFPDNEDFKTQRLRGLFDESKEYKIAKLDVENIFYAKDKANENEYKNLWQEFEKDLKNLQKTNGNQITDLISLDYLLKRYMTFIPSSTTFKKGSNTPVKANIPLYDHLKATAIFSSVISKLDEDKKENIINYYRKTNFYQDAKEFILINGDFFGIQDFIFNEIEAKSASKVLRGKSAFVQLLTKVIAFYIVDELELGFLSIISESAGKFEILAPNSDEIKEKLKKIQKELNNYFVKDFFGETGLGISFIECGLFDFIVKDNYKKQRDDLSKEVEKTKLNKFDLLNSNYEIKWDKELNNQNQCFACKKRVGSDRENIDKKVCDNCFRFIKIGKELTKKHYLVINKNSGIEIFDGYYISFVDKKEDIKGYKNNIAVFDISKDTNFEGYAKWELSSYVATKFVEDKDKDNILTFEELAQNSVKDGLIDGKREYGIEAIMSLKGDVDNMGNFIRDEEHSLTSSFASYNFFSRMIDYYFSVYVPYLMKENFQNTYTIFAGGDDLFVLGAWDEVIELSKRVRNDFIEFAKGSPLTFSVGMILTKPNKPVNFIARVSEEALEKAKDMDEKDAISLLGETVKWDDYLDDNGLKEELKLLDDNSSMLYRLLELIELSKRSKNDPKATIWKSKLSYIFGRNMDLNKKEVQNFLNNLNTMIEKYPDETKMFLNEFMYKRRVN